MNWETVREQGQLWFTKCGQFFLFQNFVAYIFASITARAVIGLPGYIGFLDHCAHWVRR